jgi:hypothetical protein
MCVLIVLFALSVNFTLPWFGQAYWHTQIEAADSQDIQSGTITLQTAQGDCQILKFDNETGRSIDNSEHCHPGLTLDSHGAPVPTGTVHRLNSISKSFLGN